jgi:hypothetical protein
MKANKVFYYEIAIVLLLSYAVIFASMVMAFAH